MARCFFLGQDLGCLCQLGWILPAYKLLTEISDELLSLYASLVLLDQGHHESPVVPVEGLDGDPPELVLYLEFGVGEVLGVQGAVLRLRGDGEEDVQQVIQLHASTAHRTCLVQTQLPRLSPGRE